MKQYKLPHDQTPGGEPRPLAAELSVAQATDFAPSPDEVARRAYFSYVNQGSSSGHEVQHWLEAEKQLLAERNLTRTHGYPHDAITHQQP